MTWIGVDPGKKGATCIITEGGVKVYPWDDMQFVHLMRELSEDEAARKQGIVACVEKVASMSHQGVRSMFSFGRSLGFIEGVLSGCWISYQLVPPVTWKRSFGLLNTDKKQSIEVVKKLIPGINLYPTERCHVESDGMADAALLALYAKRNF